MSTFSCCTILYNKIEDTDNNTHQLTVSIIKDVAFFLAPFAEQKCIVEMLDVLFENFIKQKIDYWKQLDYSDDKTKSNGQIDVGEIIYSCKGI